jgi:hypothetical protein
MSLAGSTSVGAAVKALWGRAPIWRLFAMSAGLLTLLFLLFPPFEARVTAEHPVAAPDVATYTQRTPSPVARAEDSKLPTTGTARTPPPGTPPLAEPTTHGGIAHTSPSPKTATLAMVRAKPGDVGNDSGLDEALIGRLYQRSVAIDGFNVSLPPGQWMNLAQSTITLPSATGNAHFLGRIRNKRLVGAIRIYTARSKEKPGAGFNEVKACTEVNPGRTFVSIDGEMVPNGHQACWTVRSIYTPPWQQWADRTVKLSPLDRAAAGDMTAKGVTYPQDFMSATFTRTETWGLLEVMYLFSPESEGISSNSALAVGETDWTPANIGRYPDKVAYVEKLKSWGTTFWSKFKVAFDEAH